jgi:hypothetical protein
VPGEGLNVGIAVCVDFVYVADEMLLSRWPVAMAMARIVSVEVTVIAAV